MKYDVFISYSRKDTEIANKICAAFDSVGITYFIDRKGIAGGMEFPSLLAKAIRESQLFLFLASENSYLSRYTGNEVQYAWNKLPPNSLVPYIIDNSSLPEDMQFTFAKVNIRNSKEHPVDPILVDDILSLLGKERPVVIETSAEENDFLEKESNPDEDSESKGGYLFLPLLMIAVLIGLVGFANVVCNIDSTHPYSGIAGLWHGIMFVPNWILSLFGEVAIKSMNSGLWYSIMWWVGTIVSVLYIGVLIVFLLFSISFGIITPVGIVVAKIVDRVRSFFVQK